MIPFEKLFGQKQSQMKETCIITPLLIKGLLEGFGLKQLHKGKPFASGNAQNFTLIYAPIGAPFIGDAVLYLNTTSCKNIILFGSCGAVVKTDEIKMGALVTPKTGINCESFSSLLDGWVDTSIRFDADENLLSRFMVKNMKDISIVNCATFGSLYLEEQYQQILIRDDIQVLDMECSAFFHAARFIDRKAIALFYVTDILKEKHVFDTPKLEEKKLINTAIGKGQKVLMDFVYQLRKG